MNVVFRNVTIAIEATDPKTAYSSLCKALGSMDELGTYPGVDAVDWWTEQATYTIDEEHGGTLPRPVDELWPDDGEVGR